MLFGLWDFKALWVMGYCIMLHAQLLGPDCYKKLQTID